MPDIKSQSKAVSPGVINRTQATRSATGGLYLNPGLDRNGSRLLFRIDYAFLFGFLGSLEFPQYASNAVEDAREKAEEAFEEVTDPKNPNYSRLSDTDKGRVFDAALKEAVASVGGAFNWELLSMAESGNLTLDRVALASEQFLELRVSDAESRRKAEFRRRLYLDRAPWIEAGGIEPSISRWIKGHDEWKRCKQRQREMAARLSSPGYLQELRERAFQKENEKLDQNWQKLHDVFKPRPGQYRSRLLTFNNNFLMQQGEQDFGARPQEQAAPQPPIDPQPASEAVIAEDEEDLGEGHLERKAAFEEFQAKCLTDTGVRIFQEDVRRVARYPDNSSAFSKWQRKNTGNKRWRRVLAMDTREFVRRALSMRPKPK